MKNILIPGSPSVWSADLFWKTNIYSSELDDSVFSAHRGRHDLSQCFCSWLNHFRKCRWKYSVEMNESNDMSRMWIWLFLHITPPLKIELRLFFMCISTFMMPCHKVVDPFGNCIESWTFVCDSNIIKNFLCWAAGVMRSFDISLVSLLA